jgi:hypothetical protein
MSDIGFDLMPFFLWGMFLLTGFVMFRQFVGKNSFQARWVDSMKRQADALERIAVSLEKRS